MSLPAIPEPSDIDRTSDPAAAICALVEPASRWLAQATDVSAVHDMKAKAQAIEAYAKAKGFSDDAIRSACTINLRTAAALGGLLDKRPTTPGRVQGDDDLFPDGNKFTTLERHKYRSLDANREMVEQAIAEAPTHNLSVHHVLSRIRKARKQEAHEELIAAPMPDGEYRAIVADPPWRYDNTATHGSAESHYPTMTIGDICALEVPAADDAHCYLWVTNNFIGEGLDVMKAWGFEYKTMLTWCKPQIGLGNYFRNSTEHVMFGVRGTLPLERHDVSTWFEAPRSKHSAKPDVFYELVETCTAGPWVELFCRSPRDGWDAWGNQS